MATDRFDAIVIGGGFYGCEIAAWLKTRYDDVAVLEREDDVLRRASYANQARVHGGYHYPRSMLTAMRSRMNFPRFLRDYSDSILDRAKTYYAVSRVNSNVTASQFRNFIERVGAPVTGAPDAVRALFAPSLVEDVFAVDEAVFDARVLAEQVREKLDGVTLLTSTSALEVAPAGDVLEVLCERGGARRTLRATHVFNCAYSRINTLLAASSLPAIPLKHEVAELALVRPPAALEHAGVTVMCGPFFSLMPFPPKRAHTLSHVRYTPHHEWRDEGPGMDPHEHLAGYAKKSAYAHMIRDAARFMPSLEDCAYLDESLWEVKTVLPQSESDDSRPILLKVDHGLKGLHCVLGAKIDNIYDVIRELERLVFRVKEHAD